MKSVLAASGIGRDVRRNTARARPRAGVATRPRR